MATEILISDPFMGCDQQQAVIGVTPHHSQEVPAASCFTPSDIHFVSSLNYFPEVEVITESPELTASSSAHASDSPADRVVPKMRIAVSSPVPRIEQNRTSQSSRRRKYRVIQSDAVPLHSRWIRPHSFTFTIMIATALFSHPDRSLPVTAIYDYITNSFPYFRTASTKWRNSVRHNLSQSGVFRKTGTPRTQQKGYRWTFDDKRWNWLQREIESKKLHMWRQLDRQIDTDSSVLQDLRAIGMIHPNADF